MSKDFHNFSTAVAAQFVMMSKNELYSVNVTGDELYEFYQNAFPAGTNEVFRQAREHECSTCRSFIKNIGKVVSITQTGLLTTIWDKFAGLPAPYNLVSLRMSDFIKSKAIEGIFRSEQPSYGQAQTKEVTDTGTIIWNHFSGVVAAKNYAGNDAAAQIGQANAAYNVFKRGLQELKSSAVQTVLELLNQKVLYRGEEFAFGLGQLYGMQGKYNALATEEAKEIFIWQNINEAGARLRNTAFGTLLVDLSGVPKRTDPNTKEVYPAKEPVDLEDALKAYEKVMAPENYKRPTALITPAMVNSAMTTIEALGIESSLNRRFATIADVSVNDILFVDNEVRGKMKDGSVKGLLMDVAAKQVVHAAPANAQDISIDEFIKTVVPKATSMALLIKNAHQNNFVSLTTAVDPAAQSIFKWPNVHAWSYDGNITDSIKERVKAAGGATNAVMRVSLAWFNFDDLDLHTIEPTGYELYFGNRDRKSPKCGGKLDVDMNASGGRTREAVENIVWDTPIDGDYRIVVNNYYKRETNDPGFALEIECAGVVRQFNCKSSPASGQNNNALVLTVKNKVIVGIKAGAGVIEGHTSVEKWSVNTAQYVKVDTMMLSPNHWGDSKVGNKHYIFVLEGCKNPVPTRGLYNEFLKPELDIHRKVFEVLGNKTMCQPTDQQLSGVGFSSTRGDTVTVQVNGGKTYNVKF